MLMNSFRLTSADIDRAFEAGHFFVLFQPKVSVAAGTVQGVETFVRWRHPAFGLMPPGLFLSFVEHQGRMRELTELVLTLAVRAAREFRQSGRDWGVSINLGASDIADPRLPSLLKTLTGMQGVPPHVITIEVPEHALPEPASAGETNLRTVKALGIRLALDTGPVPPQKPAAIPPGLFEEIKIGGSAIIRFAHSTRGAGVGALAMKLRAAKQIGLSAVAVGVEDDATWTALADIGFEAAQGSYIQRAVTLKALLGWHGNWREGSPAEAARAEIEFTAAPEDVTGGNTWAPARPVDPRAPQSAAELLAAVTQASTAAPQASPLEQPLDLDVDDESDVWEDEDAERLDGDLTDEEPDGEPELGSADAAPPLTSVMIDRPSARGQLIDYDGAASPRAAVAPLRPLAAAVPTPAQAPAPEPAAQPKRPRLFGSLFGKRTGR